MDRKRHAAASALNHFRWVHDKPWWPVEPAEEKKRIKTRREAREAIHRWLANDKEMAALLRGVKDHANRLYTRGWDTIIECCEDAELVAAIGDAKTVEVAIRRVGTAFAVKARYDRERDVRATIW